MQNILSRIKALAQPTIIISQTAEIGDIIYSLHLSTLIKRLLPHAKVRFLVKKQLAAIVGLQKDTSVPLLWDNKASVQTQITLLKQAKADAIIHLHPNKSLALAAKKAGIPYRIGTSTRLYHLITCNVFTHQSRAHSSLHQAQNNEKLLKPLGHKTISSLEAIEAMITCAPQPKALPKRIEDTWNADVSHIIIHPGSNGHGREWPLANIIQLIQLLPSDRYRLYLTGTQAEYERKGQYIHHTCDNIINTMGTLTLEQFLTLIGRSDALIASGTGPLHLAAAMGKHALGLFPGNHETVGAKRWRPIGPHANVMESNGCKGCKQASDCLCMLNIQPCKVAQWLSNVTAQKACPLQQTTEGHYV